MASSAAGRNDPAPIIVKKVTVIEAGHHGGAWKVAYADFVTAMCKGRAGGFVQPRPDPLGFLAVPPVVLVMFAMEAKPRI